MSWGIGATLAPVTPGAPPRDTTPKHVIQTDYLNLHVLLLKFTCHLGGKMVVASGLSETSVLPETSVSIMIL